MSICLFIADIRMRGDERRSPSRHLSLLHAPLLPTASHQAQGKGGPSRAGAPKLTVSTSSQTWHTCNSATCPEAPALLHCGGIGRAEPEGEAKGSGKAATLLGNEASWKGEA